MCVCVYVCEGETCCVMHLVAQMPVHVCVCVCIYTRMYTPYIHIYMHKYKTTTAHYVLKSTVSFFPLIHIHTYMHT